MQKSMVDMQQGSKEAVGAFQQLGLSWSDLEDKSPAEQMELIGARLAAINDPALRAETAMRIFGRAGAELIPVLVNFASETAQAKAQLGSLPDQLDRSAHAVDSLGDNLSAIRSKMTELAYGFLSEVVPALEKFTGKLSGFDAASIGAGLANALVGAFIDPMKAAGILGDTLLLGVKLMGNELIFQVQHWGEIMFRTFSVLGSDIIPMLGNNMLGALQIAAGGFGQAMFSVIGDLLPALEPIANFLGFGDRIQSAIAAISDLSAVAESLMVDGASKIAESANTFASAFESAKQHSTTVRQDFFGAEEASSKIAEDFASLQQKAKDAVREFAGLPQSEIDAFEPVQKAEADMMSEALKEVSQAPILVSPGGGMTAAQQQAAINKQLGILAGANTQQAVGQSASAQRALELQKQLDVLEARGKSDTAEANAIRQSIQTHTDIATGAVLTAEDREAASQWARENLNEVEGSFTELEKMAQQDILDRKRDAASPDAQKDKASQAGAGSSGGSQAKGASIQSIAQAVLQILQKIEPKIPQHVMS
ncbi:MAG TPA: hypothetical protein VIS96_03685 [Terrimicrobiaceae bacterium]